MKTLRCGAIVDNRDFPEVAHLGWYLDKGEPRNKETSLARLLLRAPKNKYIRHKNGNKLDCRRCNLTLVSKRTYVASDGPRRTCRSGFKGVTLRAGISKYRATIKFAGTQLHLGVFASAIEAAQAYDAAAVRLFGRQCFTNL